MTRRAHDIREPIPVARAINWRPLHGVDHVLAMLQPGATQREIFITQATLGELDLVARSATSSPGPDSALSVGVLFGDLYECPNTRAKYVVIDSLRTHTGLPMEWSAAASAIINLMAPSARHSRQILGWYGVMHGGADHLSADEEAFHRTYFDEPWYTALRLATDLRGGVAGTFFRRGALDPRAFRVPFYELLDRNTPIRGAKPTCISWPTYLTADTVVAAASVTVDSRPSMRDAAHATDHEPTGRSAWRAFRETAESMSRRYATWTAPRPHTPVSLTPSPPTARVSPTRVPERAGTNDQTHSTARRQPSQPAKLEDTTASDRPDVFIEIARADGFFLAARFDFTPDAEHSESLWVLQDPFAGLLLLVSTTASSIIDATLHYNLHVDDKDVLDATFSEYRDLASRTIYAKDACADRLRARCSALRESGALRSEWIVSPTLYFLTPSEWAWLAEASFGSARAVHELNRSRILTLPDPVIRRFHLTGPPD